MKERFKDDLKCTERGVMEMHLFVGTYKNKQVYFTKIMCPACNTVPPQYGYTCDNKKIDFDDFENVKDRKIVYNSCTDTFTE